MTETMLKQIKFVY